MALVPGSPLAERDWTIPQSQELTQGSSSIDVFNPGPTTQEVTLRARLGSGALSPYRARVSPDSTWVLSTGTQTRIPKSDPYVIVIRRRRRIRGGGRTGLSPRRLRRQRPKTEWPLRWER